jgi:radical SAM protein with 4Fe4S-binding SPASM domain
MSEHRYFILREDWQLRGYRNGVALAYNWRTGKKHFFDEIELTAARLCDGATDFASPAIPPALKRIALKLTADGMAEECAAGRSLLKGQAFRQAKNSFIDGLLLSITNRCNFRCRHCFVEAPQGRYGEMPKDALFSLLDQFAEANVPDVALTGGEPFIRPELPEFLRGLRDRRIGFTEIFTNASLLDDAALDAVEDAGFRPYFKVSFDCVGSHDYMRGVPGAEETTLRGIQVLRSRGFSVTVITSIDRVVMRGLDDTLELLAGLGVDNWWMAPPMEVGAWRGTDSNIDLEELMPVLRDILKRWDAMGRPFDLMLWRLGRYHREGRAYRGMPVRYTDSSIDCASASCLPYITPDGVLVPCGSYTGSAISSKMPNLMETPLCEAWDDPALRGLCDLVKGDVRAHNAACRSCEHFASCGSGCRVSAMLSRGDPMLSDPVCCRLHRSGHMESFHAFARELDEEAR